MVSLDKVSLNTKTGDLLLSRWGSSQHLSLHGQVGVSLGGKDGWRKCESDARSHFLKVKCASRASLVVSRVYPEAQEVQCYQVGILVQPLRGHIGVDA